MPFTIQGRTKTEISFCIPKTELVRAVLAGLSTMTDANGNPAYPLDIQITAVTFDSSNDELVFTIPVIGATMPITISDGG